MKITSMRHGRNRALPSTDLILEIERTLRARFKRAGFITEVHAQTRSSLKIGMHMCSFRIDTNVHDRNLRHNPHLPSKLTNVPTWDQRVVFNDIVNAVLNKFRISANVRSGEFTIRKGTECMTENDWSDQKPSWITENECRGYYVEACDEREYVNERRLERLKVARQRRAQAKAQPPALALVAP